MRGRGIAVAAIAIVVCLTLSSIIVDFLVDWVWFSAVGYLQVFWTIFGTRVSLFLMVFVATAIVFWVCGRAIEWKFRGAEVLFAIAAAVSLVGLRLGRRLRRRAVGAPR